jgi:large subunit ribosomal protein L1
MDFISDIKKTRKDAKERKFTESVEIIFNFKNIDFSKQQNRFNFTVSLPKGRGKPLIGGVFVQDVKTLKDSKNTIAISQEELKKFKSNPKLFRKIMKKCNFFLAEPPLMPVVAKEVGQILGPKGKMPKPLPPNADVAKIVKVYENQVLLKSKGKYLPTLQTVFGSVKMSDEDLNENANAIYTALVKELKGVHVKIKSIYIKTSMGKPVKVELAWQKKKKQ